MYRITPMYEPSETLDTAVTIDGAIDVMRKLSKTIEHTNRTLIVWDVERGQSMARVKAYNGRCTWLCICKKCKGKKTVPTIGPMGFGGTAECTGCAGTGMIDDLPA